ncbi:RDD family protein [Methylorubrum populi]
MAYRHHTTPARAGGSTRSPFAAVYARPFPELETDDAEPSPVIRADRPDTAHVRAPRFLDLGGELISALVLIAGGMLAYGHLPIA